MAFIAQPRNQMPPDKAPTPRYEYYFVAHSSSLSDCYHVIRTSFGPDDWAARHRSQLILTWRWKLTKQPAAIAKNVTIVSNGIRGHRMWPKGFVFLTLFWGTVRIGSAGKDSRAGHFFARMTRQSD
jgi:hypothetical protein